MRTINVNEEIFIKTPTMQDTVQIYELLNGDREELMDIFNFVTRDSSLEDEQNFVKSLDSDKYFFYIFYQDRVCGKIGVFSYCENENSFEIYYYLGSQYRKKGIMISTLKKFTQYVINELNVNKIKFFINTDNKKSNQVAENLGLKLIETIKKRDFCNGKYHDQNLYELHKEQLMKL